MTPQTRDVRSLGLGIVCERGEDVAEFSVRRRMGDPDYDPDASEEVRLF